MEKVFDDEFMEIQTGMVALCLEALEDVNIKVDKVYMPFVMNIRHFLIHFLNIIHKLYPLTN